MPVQVDDVSKLQTCLRGVLADAKHHTKAVEEIVLVLAGAIISRKDSDAPLEVMAWGVPALSPSKGIGSFLLQSWAKVYRHEEWQPYGEPYGDQFH